MRNVVALALALSLVTACSKSWTSVDGGDLGAGGGDLYLSHSDATYDGIFCGETAFTIDRTTPDMLILLDRSNSMGDGDTPNWTSCRNAIYDVTATLDTQIWFGLFVFPSSLAGGCHDLDNQCVAPGKPVVAVGPGTAGAIKNALAPMSVCGGTPTADTLKAAKQFLTGVDTSTHPRYILLATDGGPNCNGSLDEFSCTCTGAGICWNDAENCLDDVVTYQVLDDLCKAGIKTYVVGLGTDPVLSGVLSAMAQHGCTGKAYAPNDPASIKNAFAEITAGVATCSFEMDCSKIPDPYLVNFYFDGHVVPRTPNHQSGWDWTSLCTAGKAGTGVVEFYGADCTTIKNRLVAVVSAKFGCATVIK